MPQTDEQAAAMEAARDFVARRDSPCEYANTDRLTAELAALLERREREAVEAAKLAWRCFLTESGVSEAEIAALERLRKEEGNG